VTQADDEILARSAAITGMGIVSPAGSTLSTFWDTLCAGRSVARPIVGMDVAQLPVRFACQVDGFDPSSLLSPKEARRLDLFVQYGLVAALAALDDAGNPAVDKSIAGIVFGSGSGGSITKFDQTVNFLDRGHSAVHPLMIPMTMPNAGAAHVAIRLGWEGPNLCLATACATGAHALGEGLRLLRDGSASIVLAGSSEASLIPLFAAGFANLQALSTRNDAPELASRPFDRDRDGFVMSEGAAFCVLERPEAARSRGARIYALLTGYAQNIDAYHMVMPAPDGAGATVCMQRALRDAGVEPADVVQVNAHGTSTPLNDRAEALALHRVFGEHVPPVTAPKGVLGHMVSSAGTAEAIACCLSLTNAVIPPTANFTEPDPGLDLDVVAGSPRPMLPGTVISNSFAFGGHNVTLVFGPPYAASTPTGPS